MKIAFLYGKYGIGHRTFDFDHLYDSPRGLTGSELSWLELAQAMKARGHEVLLIVGQAMEQRVWRGIPVRQLDDPRAVDGFDAVLSWNEPDLLREVSPGPLKIVNQQLNDFGYCRPEWWKHIDLVTSPSAHHLEFLKGQAPGVKAWTVLPNGCDPALYDLEAERVSGRVIWASSPDRGLHRLLEVWPEIKARVPHASLRCFYNFQAADFDDYEVTSPNVHPDLLEIAQRKRYIQHAMSRLAGPRWNVEHVGSVSRDRMAREWEQAMVLGYPCDTIRYTEGFSVTTMEACASGCLPVITDVDSLGHIYGSAAPMVHHSGSVLLSSAMNEFVDLVVRGLTDEDWRAERVAACRALAEKHSWTVLAERLENIIKCGVESRSAMPSLDAISRLGSIKPSTIQHPELATTP